VRAYRALPRFRWRARFSTWLFGLARNCAVDTLRRRERESRAVARMGAEQTSSDPSLRVAIDAAIDRLPDDLRRAFVLVEVFGFGYPEASAILGWPVGTLKSRMHRARRMLIGSLSDEEDSGAL